MCRRWNRAKGSPLGHRPSVSACPSQVDRPSRRSGGRALSAASAGQGPLPRYADRCGRWRNSESGPAPVLDQQWARGARQGGAESDRPAAVNRAAKRASSHSNRLRGEKRYAAGRYSRVSSASRGYWLWRYMTFLRLSGRGSSKKITLRSCGIAAGDCRADSTCMHSFAFNRRRHDAGAGQGCRADRE